MTPVSWAIFCLYFIVKMPNLLDIRLGRPKRPHYLMHFRLVIWRRSTSYQTSQRLIIELISNHPYLHAIPLHSQFHQEEQGKKS